MPKERLPKRARDISDAAEDQVAKYDPNSGNRRLHFLYLEGIEAIGTDPHYTVTFEYTPQEIMIAFLNEISPKPDYFTLSTGMFIWENLTKAELLNILVNKRSDNIDDNYIEGSWYLADLTLIQLMGKDGFESSQKPAVNIHQYFNEPEPDLYEFQINNLELICFPEMSLSTEEIVYRSVTSFELFDRIPSYFGFDVTHFTSPNQVVLDGFEDTSERSAKRQRFERTTEIGVMLTDIPVDITSIGVMDVGIAGCNLLIAGGTPVCYYDVGHPLPKYAKTFPADFKGPIEGLPVVLSHWDWDHWYLALKYPNLAKNNWYVNTNSPLSGKALAFKNSLQKNNKLKTFSPKSPPFTINNIIIGITSTTRISQSFAKNNTGLGMVVSGIKFNDNGNQVSGNVVLTGDANFDSFKLLGSLEGPISSIAAVHHGSNNDGAANNLPTPKVSNPTKKANDTFSGRIAYSYGMSYNGIGQPWRRPYGFPVPAAISNYRFKGWETEMSTAEGTQINMTVPPTKVDEQPPNRGNIRIGNQTPLASKYKSTSFFAIKHKLD